MSADGSGGAAVPAAAISPPAAARGSCQEVTPPPVEPDPALDVPPVVVSRWTEQSELFVEFPPLVEDATSRFAIHFTDLKTFEPLREGRATVRLTEVGPGDPGRDAAFAEFTVDAPGRPGIFGIDVTPTRAGRFGLELVLDAAAVQDRHDLGTVVVLTASDAANQPMTDEEEDGAIPFLKEQQWALDFATTLVEGRSMAASLEVPAEIEPRTGGQADVTTAVAGRLVTDVQARPVGSFVNRGETLAEIIPRSGHGEDRPALELAVAEARDALELAAAARARADRLVLDEIRERLSLVPGTNITIGQPISHRIDHMLSGSRANVAVKILGDDLAVLRSLGEQAVTALQGTPGVVDLALEPQADIPTVRVRFDRAALARHGLPAGEAALTLPDGYRIEYGGQFEAEAEASRVLLGLGLAAVGGIFLILLSALRSTRDAAIVMINLPLALIGGVVGVFLGGGILSIASLIGFISLFGIATRNGIMLVTHIRHLRHVEGVSDLREAVVRGAVNRIVPILMTALSTGLALVPVALAFGEPGSEIQAPLALVIVCGLVSSTVLNMFVVPAAYLAAARRQPA